MYKASHCTDSLFSGRCQCHWCEDNKHLPVSPEGPRKQLAQPFPLLFVSPHFKKSGVSTWWQRRRKNISDKQSSIQSASPPSLILCTWTKLCLLTLSSLRIQAFLLHCLSQYLLNLLHMPATPLGTGNRIMSKDRCGACLLHGACSLWNRQPLI